jgi:hypothetical protein
MVAMTFQQRGQEGGRGRGRGGGVSRGQQRGDEVTTVGTRAPQTYEEYRDMSCLAHIDPAMGKPTYSYRRCKWCEFDYFGGAGTFGCVRVVGVLLWFLMCCRHKWMRPCFVSVRVGLALFVSVVARGKK